jgi:hypothetical protein
MRVFVNPYHCFDALGRLAGAAHEAQPDRPPGVMPHGRRHGARLEMTPGSFVPDSERKGAKGRDVIYPTIVSRSDTPAFFDEDPFDLDVDPATAIAFKYNLELVKDGVLLEAKDDQVPIAALAAERLKLVLSWRAHYGDREIPFDTWQQQFALDEEVAEAMVALEKSDAEAKAKALAAKNAFVDEEQRAIEARRAERKAERVKAADAAKAAAAREEAEKQAAIAKAEKAAKDAAKAAAASGGKQDAT